MSQNTFPGISFLGISLENSYIPIYPFAERFKRNRRNHDVRKCESSNNPVVLRKKKKRILVVATMFYHIQVPLKYEKSVHFLQLTRT